MGQHRETLEAESFLLQTMSLEAGSEQFGVQDVY